MLEKQVDYCPPDIKDVPVLQAILKTLLYFDIFHYPLTKDEILNFLTIRTTPTILEDAIEVLVAREYVFKTEEYYHVDRNEAIVNRRKSGNRMAEASMPIAKSNGELIGKFPFVVSVMASGSLSKGYMDEKSDLDFFIITQPNRLWIAKMLLIFYKRVFRLNSYKFFCINYFISSDHLEIEEKNQFTATELATVIPLYGSRYYLDLMQDNRWLTHFFPNYKPRTVLIKNEGNSIFKNLIERTINVAGGDFWDRLCMAVNQKRLSKLHRKQYTDADFNVAFKCKRYVSKNHPRNFQRTVTVLLEEKWQSYWKSHNVERV